MSSLPLLVLDSKVTQLLITTKNLNNRVQRWSQHQVTEQDVLNAYVEFGNEFKLVCRAFHAVGAATDDMADVPQRLRLVLEQALSEPPGHSTLEKHLPTIREIIISLLQTLKRKHEGVKRSFARPAEPGTHTRAHVRLVSDTARTMPLARTPAQHSRSASGLSTAWQPAEAVAETTETRPALATPALEQLQKGDLLKRRASKRFLAYQYAKLAGNTGPGRESWNEEVSVRVPLVRTAPAAAHRLTLFLTLGTRTKRAHLSSPPTMSSLRLLFMETFAYSPGADAFPEMCIKDRKTGVMFELEEADVEHEVVDGSVIGLQERSDPMKEVMEAVAEVRKDLAALKVAVEEKPQPPPAAKELAKDLPARLDSFLFELPVATPTTAVHTMAADLAEIRRQLAAVRKQATTHKATVNEGIEAALSTVRVLRETHNQSMGGSSEGRSYMELCHASLSATGDALLTQVDMLSDQIETMRKDVAVRGVRVLPKLMEQVARDLAHAKEKRHAHAQYIAAEMPSWKKVWEAELNTVCEEQQFFNLQEDIVADLDEDLARIQETFSLVEECVAEQSRRPRARHGPLVPLPPPGVLAAELRDAMLAEVMALAPNSESRVEAIQRAEEQRQRELQLDTDEFQEELGDFVKEGKLKSLGGFEEVERMRQLKDEENLRLGMMSYAQGA